MHVPSFQWRVAHGGQARHRPPAALRRRRSAGRSGRVRSRRSWRRTPRFPASPVTGRPIRASPSSHLARPADRQGARPPRGPAGSPALPGEAGRSPRTRIASVAVIAGLSAVSGATRPTGPRRVASVVTQNVAAIKSESPIAPGTPLGSGRTTSAIGKARPGPGAATRRARAGQARHRGAVSAASVGSVPRARGAEGPLR